MKIERITLRRIKMPLVHFFETSFGRTYERQIIIVEVTSEGLSGWGEVTCGENPFYNEEWTNAAWMILRDYAAPRILGHEFASAAEVAARMAHIRGHLMARGGLEVACWDLQARQNNRPLYQEIGGGARKEIPCGVSIGIQDSVEQLIAKIETELADGYQRIKMKIKPGWDIHVMNKVRGKFPQIKLMGDANSAYTLNDAGRLKHLDEFYLMMLEQPLAHDEIIDHVVREVEKHGAAIAGLPAVDTIKQVERAAESALITSTIPRERIVQAQTPQGFRYELIKRAFDSAAADGFIGTDEASLVERMGENVWVVMGSARNIKITTPGDMELAEFLISKSHR